jgi:hypothetical protein
LCLLFYYYLSFLAYPKYLIYSLQVFALSISKSCVSIILKTFDTFECIYYKRLINVESFLLICVHPFHSY